MENEYFELAKRLNNTKRQYLLVNPLQAKHIPVSPTLALEMMSRLGDEVKKRYPNVGLVVGFAETATAIGVVVAGKFSCCRYVQTTREEIPRFGRHIDFLEEHSHAVNQTLCVDGMQGTLENTDTVVFVDDEISTGKTIINMARQLETIFPDLKYKKKVLASIINRASEQNLELLSKAGFDCITLSKIENRDYTPLVSGFDVKSPKAVGVDPFGHYSLKFEPFDVKLDPRTETDATEYIGECERLAKRVAKDLTSLCGKIAVLGTEECMFPALCVGREIERKNPNVKVFSHSTTRSPICVSEDEGYPVKNGRIIRSFYDEDRINYVYNLNEYDLVVIVSDAWDKKEEGERDLIESFVEFGCKNFLSVTRSVKVEGAL